MKTSIHHAELKHKAVRDGVISILRKHSNHLSALEILAVMSHLVGQLIAIQDQSHQRNGVGNCKKEYRTGKFRSRFRIA